MSYAVTAQGWTNSSFGATGATSLVAAPAAGSSIRINDIIVNNNTNTTAFVQVGFREGAGGSIYFYHQSQSIGASQPISLTLPWLVDTATAFQATCSVTAASTPSVQVAVHYEIVNRAR